VLQRVLVQVSVQAEASLVAASDPLQPGQVGRVAGRRPPAVALGDAVDEGRAFAGRGASGAGLGEQGGGEIVGVSKWLLGDFGGCGV